jgi:predicted nucleic acid-binding protein
MPFLDTNILVYGFDRANPFKQGIAKDLIRDLLKRDAGVVSWQVVQEFANVACKKFAAPALREHAAEYIDDVIEPMNRVASSTRLIHEALSLQGELKYGFYDCLIIAAALQAKADTLYSEDLQDGQLVRGQLRIVNPFAAAVHEPSSSPVVSYQFRYTDR